MRVLKIINLILLYGFLVSSFSLARASLDNRSVIEDKKATWSSRFWSEWMTPTIGNPDVRPESILSIFSLEYATSPQFRIVYRQKMATHFSASTRSFFKDPRFAYRYYMGEVSAQAKTYTEVYVQPSFTAESRYVARLIEFGHRLVYNRKVPFFKDPNHWTYNFYWGVNTDIRYAIYGDTPVEKTSLTDVSGFIIPWVSYKISPKVYTQHRIYVPFQHKLSTEFTVDEINFGSLRNVPYFQNGVGVQINSDINAVFYLNHNLFQGGTFSSYWLSAWVSVRLL